MILTTADYAPEIEARADLLGVELMRKPVKPAQLRSLLTYMLA